MEQLARLSNAIAEAYLRHLKYETGGNQFEHDGISGDIILENLSDGLLTNAYAAAKNKGKSNVEALAYQYLLPLINLQGRHYQITPEGLALIEFMTVKELSKFKAKHQLKIH
ncbi:hypothetical protein AI29_13790 [bacteria symbiont BFo2 of Frankliniella occidentalis]|uniref:hypothetical protein n=1 Tax=Rosenbergiella collisarenosi TaxID=1544695 RepID=UPI0006645C6A|nr:hypothetical protein [Rosenbergiella collisarenosi]KMV67348.1 hypothetical protein AI29_13790 [bacteria symbiont BFo2 of Frankliniella occidentalis]KYP92536.1 hypothetical protein WB60_05040 [bacteria symbiont BFo2 of Frankliniella occidentalis]KYP94199.1 hypothetical protein WB67_10570 [bacteria symbiont BFo2 of Frankliniella occidentalis]